MVEIKTEPASSLMSQDSKAYEALFLVSFVFVLMIALAAQVLFLNWRTWLPGAENEKSLIGGVKTGVYTFMSHLN
jgi:light-harvesting complex 1 beta chain